MSDTNQPPPRASIAEAITTASPTIRPAVANALWPRLQRARDDPRTWVKPKLYIPLQTGSGGGGVRTTTPPVPPPDERYRWEVLYEQVMLYAFMSRIKSRIGRAFTVKLHKADHDRLLQMVDGAHRAEYDRALRDSYCEKPFYRAPELPSGWRRNSNDPLITPRVASVLESLAALAIVEFMEPKVEDALIS